jgi:hypothetical protein
MAPQGDSTDGADAPMLIRSEEIPASGRVEVELPGGVPLFEVLRRPDGGIAQGRDGQIYHVAGMNFGREGEEARCVGCHAGHTFFDVPEDEDIAWTNLGPSASVSASGTFRGLVPPVDPNAGRDQDGDGIPDDERDPDAAGNVPEGRAPGRNNDPAAAVVPPVPGISTTPFAPHNVVDRSTRAFGGEWVAMAGEDAELRLRWTIPVRAREIILHAPEAGEFGLFGPRDMQINRLTVKLLRSGVVVHSNRLTQTLRLGERLPLAINSEIEFDSLRIEIAASDVEGFYEEGGGAAIAEVEVIGQVANENSRPLVFVRRGDATCDGAVNIADPISVLNRLFSGGPRLCCEIAADVDGNASVNMTDAVQVLNFLFRGGPPPVAPGPEDCGGVEENRLFCDSEAACP